MTTRVVPEKWRTKVGETVIFTCHAYKNVTWDYRLDIIAYPYQHNIELVGPINGFFYWLKIVNATYSNTGTYNCRGVIRNSIYGKYSEKKTHFRNSVKLEVVSGKKIFIVDK